MKRWLSINALYIRIYMHMRECDEASLVHMRDTPHQLYSDKEMYQG